MVMAMEELYSEELRTPPMPLAALVGLPELHSTISTYLQTEALPINILALPDFSKVSVIAGKERKSIDNRPSPPPGILKIEWLRKHRTQVPAALVVLLKCEDVCGDPAQWMQVCAHLDNIKNAIHGRNTKLIIVTVQSTLLSGDGMEERILTLRKRTEVDAKCFLTFVSHPPELKRSLARLGNILSELITIYYKEEGRTIKLRLEKKPFSSNELNIRYNFKAAVYAEFRRDWSEALKYYESAYTLLQEVVNTPVEVRPLQHLVELKTVAEQLHFKVSTLLLHGGKEGEAVKWFRQHMRFYKPLVGPTEGSFLHWAWVSKQFVVFGSLLQDSLASVSEAKSGSNTLPETQVTGRELHPSYYYQLAAHYMIQRRQSSQTISSTYGAIHEDVLGRPEETSPPLYVGQSSRICAPGAKGDARCPTDEEYMLHAVIEERLFPHSVITINLFKRAYELYKNIQAGRMGYFVACEMGREYFNARDYANAKQLFDSVAGMYRQEAWVSLLWTVLGFLRECARQMDHLREYIDYSLEMAALPPVFTGHKVDTFGFNQHGPAGPLCQSQRERISTEVIGLLRGEQTVLPSKDGQNGLTVVDSDPVCVNIDMASPLRAVFTACVAFHESTAKPGHKTLLTLSLFTRLPQRIHFQELEICFNQPKCNVILVKDAHEVSKDGFEVKTGFDLHLEPNKWTRFSFNLIPGQSGKLECLSVTAHLGALASIRCQVESPASREDVFYWKLEPQLEMMPLKDSALSNYGQKTIQIEDQDPVVDLVLETVVSPALVNELFPVVISVMPKGHPVHGGEIKFAITEASTASALTSPSLIPSVSLDTSSIELLIVSPSDDMDESLKSFSGILQVPEIATDGSFSTHIYMRWKKAMAVTLFATFSYQIEPVSASDSGYPSHSFIHRELQLQCEDPFTLSYRHMSPFRRGALLLGNMKKSAGTEMDRACVPVDEITTLILTLENSSSVNLELISITVNDTNESLCLVRAEHTINGKVNNVSSLLPANQKSDFCCEPETEECKDVPTIRCGEIYSCLFYIQPLVESAALSIASICIKWRRLVDKNTKPSVDRMLLNSSSTSVTSMLSSLPSLQVEKPVMLAIFDSPPHAVLGVPIDICLKLQNLTSLPQEIDFSIIDSAGFILSGAHCSTVHLLPHAKDVVSCKLVPIASGPQQLPQFNLISKRYNAGFQQSSSSIQIFVFPSSMLAKNYNFLPS